MLQEDEALFDPTTSLKDFEVACTTFRDLSPHRHPMAKHIDFPVFASSCLMPPNKISEGSVREYQIKFAKGKVFQHFPLFIELEKERKFSGFSFRERFAKHVVNLMEKFSSRR